MGTTYTPVAHMDSIWAMCALAVQNNWELWQFDVDAAFINASTGNQEIDIEQIPGYVDLSQPGKVCGLHKWLYGHPKSGHEWHVEFTHVLSSMGFSPSPQDHSVFFQRHGDKVFLIPAYVDDGPVAGMLAATRRASLSSQSSSLIFQARTWDVRLTSWA